VFLVIYKWLGNKIILNGLANKKSDPVGFPSMPNSEVYKIDAN